MVIQARPVEVVGGAAFPAEDGVVFVSWPLVRATLTDDAITLAARGVFRSPNLHVRVRLG
jgi:hypothetical protein